MHEDYKGNLWIGNGTGLVYKNANENVIREFENPKSLKGVKNKQGAIQNMIPRADGKVWFCSWNGLFLFDPETASVIARYGSDASDEYYLPADIFYYIHQDKEGIYWVGTGDGLIRWKGPKAEQNKAILSNSDEEYRLFTRSDGLSNDVIYAIFEDDYNRLWMSSDYGIMSLDKKTLDVQAYLPKDGISHQEFNRIAQFQEEDGTIYFGGLNGITAFHPKDFFGNKNPSPKLLITGLEVFDGIEEKLLDKIKDIQLTQEINFYPNDRFFRLKFVLPTFQDKSQILYAWKIEGVDKNWNYQKENSLQIGMLPYGNHKLRIKGQSGDGGWSPHELKIKVNVWKPLYLKTWFILTMVGLLLGLIWLFFKERTRVLKKEINKATNQIQRDKQTIATQAEDLRQLDKLKSRFFANVSHELRTPLTLIMGPIKSLLKSNKFEIKERNLLVTAKNSSENLLKLVSSLLDLSKVESSKMELNEEPAHLFGLMKPIMASFESYAEIKELDLLFDYKMVKTIVVFLDKEKYKVIINNLLSNALKFTPKKGKISVIVKEENHLISIQVTDTGRGVREEDLAFVFDRFFQTKNIQTKAEGGTGIGLALSHEFAQLMKGYLSVESVFGEGARFILSIPFVLPVVDLSAVTEIQHNEEDWLLALSKDIIIETPIFKEGSHILIVEDNDDLRAYISMILSAYYKVTVAENGVEAMALINETPDRFDLITSDIMMPIMDGFELIERLKSDKEYKNIPLVMLTARADFEDKLRALRIGVDDYLLKPFDEEELIARIENLLGHARNRLEIQTNDTIIERVESEDDLWLKTFEAFVEENLENDLMSINFLLNHFIMSESSLKRQVKRLTGLTPAKYVQEFRLISARKNLENKRYNNIADVSYKYCFKDPKYFSRLFKARFGKTPSAYLK